MTHSLTTDKTAVDEQVFSHCRPVTYCWILLTSRFSHSGPDCFGPEINTMISMGTHMGHGMQPTKGLGMTIYNCKTRLCVAVSITK